MPAPIFGAGIFCVEIQENRKITSRLVCVCLLYFFVSTEDLSDREQRHLRYFYALEGIFVQYSKYTQQ
jgi:hypothetical protein